MSRAVRRQQAGSEKAAPARRSLGNKTPRPTRGQRPPVQPRRRFRPGAPGWVSDIFSELKKVTWPSREETTYLTMVVIVVAVVSGMALGAVDIFFSWLVDSLLLR